MTDNRLVVLARIAELTELLEDWDIRIGCCTNCGEHPVAFSTAILEGDHPHITLYPDIDNIFTSDVFEEEEEDDLESDLEDQARNDAQKRGECFIASCSRPAVVFDGEFSWCDDHK